MDHWVDRPEVQARQRAQPTGTNRPTRTTHTHTHTHPHQRPSAPGRAANQTPRPLRSPEPTHPTPHTGAGHQGPRTTTPPPSRRPQRAGKRPDPYRTRKLSPPAPMVLPPPGSGRVGHHRNTHHRPARGRRPNQAPTPTRAKPTPTPTPPPPTAARDTGEETRRRRRRAKRRSGANPAGGHPDESRRLLDTDHATDYSDRNLNRIR